LSRFRLLILGIAVIEERAAILDQIRNYPPPTDFPEQADYLGLRRR
jgi:hypothetical protein